MGLYVHSLGEIPTGTERAYYVYLLDYGWEESLGNAVRANLPKMADLASRSNAVVIHGPRGVHFEDEVLSWHRVNGQDAKDILPAILVSTRHPSTFRESFEIEGWRKEIEKRGQGRPPADSTSESLQICGRRCGTDSAGVRGHQGQKTTI